MTMVNFRMPESQYSAVQAVARRRNISFSQFMRYCIDRACKEAEELERQEDRWKAALPRSVRDLIGIAGNAAAEACVAVIDANKALYIKAPGDAPTTDAYLALFSAKSTFDSGSGNYVVTIELNAEGQETLQDQADADVAAAIADPTATKAEIATIPGLYYTFEGGTDVKDITTPGETTLATEEKTIVPKPDLGKTNQAFYQLKVDTAK